MALSLGNLSDAADISQKGIPPQNVAALKEWLAARRTQSVPTDYKSDAKKLLYRVRDALEERWNRRVQDPGAVAPAKRTASVYEDSLVGLLAHVVGDDKLAKERFEMVRERFNELTASKEYVETFVGLDPGANAAYSLLCFSEGGDWGRWRAGELYRAIKDVGNRSNGPNWKQATPRPNDPSNLYITEVDAGAACSITAANALVALLAKRMGKDDDASALHDNITRVVGRDPMTSLYYQNTSYKNGAGHCSSLEISDSAAMAILDLALGKRDSAERTLKRILARAYRHNYLYSLSNDSQASFAQGVVESTTMMGILFCLMDGATL